MALSKLSKRHRSQSPVPDKDADEKQCQSGIHVNDLSIDVLSYIFTFLPLSQRWEIDEVCQYWMNANQFEWSQTKKIDYSKWINQTRKIVTADSIKPKLHYSLKYLTDLSITEYMCDSTVIDYINNYCIKLINLDFKIYLNNLNHKYIKTGLKNLTKLKKIKIVAMTNGIWEADNIALFQIFLLSLNNEMNEIYLQSHDYNKPRIEFDDHFATIFLGFGKLSNLTLRFFCINRDGIEGISEMINLKYLNLHGCEIDYQIPILNLINLEHLTLSWLYENLDENLIYNIGVLNKLKYLDIHCSSVETIGKYDNIANLTSLVHLDINNCVQIDDDFILNLIYNCKDLKYLNIACCSLLSPEVLNELTELNNLEHLILDKTDCLDGVVIYLLSEKAVNLKHLDISCVENVTVDAIESIGKLKNLESLRMNRVSCINDLLISSIVFNCHNIKHLDLSSSMNLTKNAYYDIAQLKHLERLVNVHSLDVQYAIPTVMNKLKYFNCAYSYKVCDKHVLRFIKNSPNLEELNISQNPITVELFKIIDKITNKRKNNMPLKIYTNRNFFPLIREKICRFKSVKLSTETAFKEHPYSDEINVF